MPKILHRTCPVAQCKYLSGANAKTVGPLRLAFNCIRACILFSASNPPKMCTRGANSESGPKMRMYLLRNEPEPYDCRAEVQTVVHVFGKSGKSYEA